MHENSHAPFSESGTEQVIRPGPLFNTMLVIFVMIFIFIFLFILLYIIP